MNMPAHSLLEPFDLNGLPLRNRIGGHEPTGTPREMSLDDIRQAVADYRNAALLANTPTTPSSTVNPSTDSVYQNLIGRETGPTLRHGREPNIPFRISNRPVR